MESQFVFAAVLVVVLGMTTYVARRRLRERRDRLALASAVERNVHVPQSLHPLIDTDVCIGSLSCLKACPEGDILGIVDGAAQLIRGTNCIGHGRCAAECPVGAIKLVFGTSERGVDLPEVDESFESSRPGVHIVGELGGMGLIRNSVTQGVECAEYLAERKGPLAPGAVDVAIIGAGPAGLGAALGCKQAGLSFRVLEQGKLGGTMAQYPRQKVVMTDPFEVPFYGKIGKRFIPKEELIATWEKVLARADVAVEEGVKVTGIEGVDGAFAVQTSNGPVAARKVVLATGRRGTPRKLGVPGEDSAKVTYALLDPEQYANARVLVVGGGDSALEAALSLADAGAQVTFSYRGQELGRARESNRQRFAQAVAAGRIRALMPSTVAAIGERDVVLDCAGTPTQVANEFVFVLIGGEAPLAFLKTCGVEVKRFHGQSARRGSARADSRDAQQARARRRLAWLLLALGAATLALLAWKGGAYYLLPAAARRAAEGHATLRSSGVWGHGIGLVATAFMLSNFLYALRKRVRWFKYSGKSSIRTWLTFHMFVGFMSPLVILFHAAFQANNQLAAATLLALLIVVSTGVIGRYIYGLVPRHGGLELERAELLAEVERHKARLEPMLAHVGDPGPVRALLADASAPARGGLVVLALARMPFDRLRTRLRLARVRQHFTSAAEYAEFRAAMLRLVQLRTLAGFFGSFKRLLSGWRLLHAVLAMLLVLIIAAHIGLSLFLGYRWIF